MNEELSAVYAALVWERYRAPILPAPGREPVRAEVQRRHARMAGQALDHAPQNYRRGWRGPVDNSGGPCG